MLSMTKPHRFLTENCATTAYLIFYLEFGAPGTSHGGGGWLLGVVQLASPPQHGAGAGGAGSVAE